MIWGQTFGHDGWTPAKIIATNAQLASMFRLRKIFFEGMPWFAQLPMSKNMAGQSSNDLVRERLQRAGLWSALRSHPTDAPLPLSCPALLVADAHALLAGLQQARCGSPDNSVMTAQQRFNMAGIPL